jgi:hypothetical protein
VKQKAPDSVIEKVIAAEEAEAIEPLVSLLSVDIRIHLESEKVTQQMKWTLNDFLLETHIMAIQA